RNVESMHKERCLDILARPAAQLLFVPVNGEGAVYASSECAYGLARLVRSRLLTFNIGSELHQGILVRTPPLPDHLKFCKVLQERGRHRSMNMHRIFSLHRHEYDSDDEWIARGQNK